MKLFFTLCLLEVLFFSTSFAQSKFGIETNGVAAFPQSDFGDFYKIGTGGSISFFYNSSERLSFALTSGYLNFNFDNEKFNSNVKSVYPDAQNVDFNIGFKTIPLLLETRFYLSDNDIKPFFSVDIGLHFLNFSLPSIVDSNAAQITTISKSEVKIGVGIGAGILLPLNEFIKLEFAAKYNSINEQTQQSATYVSQYTVTINSSNTPVTFYTISAGILIQL